MSDDHRTHEDAYADGDQEMRLVRIPPIERPAAPVLVRPVIDEIVEDWVAELAEVVGASPGRRIGFAGPDLHVAARLASDLAAWTADRGTPVVLVDGSIEEPVISKPMREDGDEGLVDALSFGVSLESVRRRTLAGGVSVVTAGSYPLDAESALRSRAFRAVLEELSADGSAVMVVLPLPGARDLLAGLDSIAIVAEDAGEISAAAEGLSGESGADVTGVLVGGAPDEAPVAERRRRLPEETPFAAATGPAARPVEPTSHDVEPERVSEAPSTRRGRRRSRWTVAVPIVVLLVAATAWLASRPQDARRPPSSGPRMTSTTSDRRIEEAPPALRGERPDADEGRATEASAGAAEGSSVQDDREDTRTVGPREEAGPSAEAAREQRSNGGEEDVPVALPAGAPAGPYRLYLSSHRLRSAAERETAAVRARGIDVTLARAELEERGTWFRVELADGYSNLAVARRALDMLHKLGYEGAWVEYRR